MDKLVKEETEKVQRSFDNQLADLQAKQAAAPQVQNQWSTNKRQTQK